MQIGQSLTNWCHAYVSQTSARIVLQAHDWTLSQAGPQHRVGSSSLTETNAYYDGGFTSAGIFTYYVSYFGYTGGEGQQPDAQWTFSHESCTFVDHGSFIGTGRLAKQASWFLSGPNIYLSPRVISQVSFSTWSFLWTTRAA